MGIVGLIAAVFLTFRYMDEAAQMIGVFTGNDLLFAAAAIIFILTLICAQLLDYFARKFIQLVELESFNRLLGGIFGLLKGAIIVSAVLVILAGFEIPSEQTRKESLIYSHVIQVAPWAYNIIATEDFVDMIDETLENPIDNFPIFNDSQQ